MEQDFSLLYNGFTHELESGNEERARKFLAEHLKEFPEDIQAEIAFSFLEEGVEETAAMVASESNLEREATDYARMLQKVKRVLEDKLKVKDLMGERE